MKKSFIYLLLITSLLTSCKQSENNSNSYEDTPTMQLKDAAHEMMNGRNIQDSIDNAKSEEEDRDGRNAYVMQRMDSIDEAEAQQQNNQEQELEQPQHAKMIICPNCNGTGEGYKKCPRGGCENGSIQYQMGKYHDCPTCGGSGKVQGYCKVCGGQGRVNEYE